ncbi:MAG: SDR family NAD(P)-dependent oxidoreductase [Actinomycetales bacterium]
MRTDLFSLTGLNALVTGAGGAIGTVLCRGLQAAGATVAAQDLTIERAEATGMPVSIATDLSQAQACRELVDQATGALGGIDILVNCAGTNRRKPIDDVTEDDFDAIVAVNMRAVYFTSQAVHATMRARGAGSIVNISSLSAKYSYQTISVYAATKAAVTSMTRSFAQEWARDAIRVNCIEPSVVQTEFTKPLWGEPHRQRWFEATTPLGRLARPEDLVGAVIYLASPASAYVTGQALTIEGGILSGDDWDAYARATRR